MNQRYVALLPAMRAAVEAKPTITQAELAVRLGVGRRAIQRCLAAHGVTMAGLRASVLLEKYDTLARDPDLNESEKAYALGFESVSALSHFRQRWRGKGEPVE